MSVPESRAPAANAEIHGRLFAIETVLRELIIETLSGLDGPKWYQHRLPSECREQFKMGVERDRTTKWTRNIPHHPVYYIDFPDLRLTIEQKENWTAGFREIFPKAKDLVTTDLVELEFIRNKVAHNRRATESDLEVVRAAYSKLMNILGSTVFTTLASRYTVEPDIRGHLELLLREGDIALTIAVRGRTLARLNHWQEAKDKWWWFDESYLGYSLSRITAYFAALREYQGLAPELGVGDRLAWAVNARLGDAHRASKEDLGQVLLRWKT
jgi:hypothetical protein